MSGIGAQLVPASLVSEQSENINFNNYLQYIHCYVTGDAVM